MHFIAQELSRLGPTRFFSTSFSMLSWLKRDQRLPLWTRANAVETVDGVESYLWRTWAHPFKAPAALEGLMRAGYAEYLRRVPDVFRRWVEEADVVLLESGGPEIFFDIVRRLNRRCRLIYISSDHLDTIGASPFVKATLDRVASQFDGIRVPSRRLVEAFPHKANVFVVPHGIDATELHEQSGTPYPGPGNVVSVGNMLFDPSFFEAAASAFPGLTFHVIGAGEGSRRLKRANVVVHGEMPFKETIRYVRHADVGVAAYDAARVASYLVDTSMKLMQYEFFGLPAVCPAIVAGDRPGRFGYDAAEPASIVAAMNQALSHGRFKGSAFLSWADVTQRILHPERYPDTFPRAAEPARASARA